MERTSRRKAGRAERSIHNERTDLNQLKLFCAISRMKSVVAFPSSEFKSVTRCEVVALEHRIQGSENKLSILRTTASREFAKEHSALLCRSVRARKDDEEQRLEHIYRIAHIVRF